MAEVQKRKKKRKQAIPSEDGSKPSPAKKMKLSGETGTPVVTGTKKKKKKKKKKVVATPAASKEEATPTPPKEEEKEEQEEEQEEEQNEEEQKTFADLGLAASLVESCAALGWKMPTPIQVQSIPPALEGRDVIGLAETGSGKTGAFGLPMLHQLLQNPQGLFGLVLAPTRELAFQISEQLEALGASMGVRSVVIVGGVDMMAQAIALAKKPHIIVASPGRIVDHLENTKGFNLNNLKFLVMDEADRLLNMDFEVAIDKLLQVIPRERTTYLFSATMTSKVNKLQRTSLSNPIKVSVSGKYQTVKTLIQNYIFLPAKYKSCYLAFLCNELAGQTMIIFTSTCEHAQRVAVILRNLGFSAIPLHGKLTQPARLAALNKFKAGDRSLLVATDVASRGLDIPSVDVVINYDVIQNSKDYIHRVGRTARAGRSGRAVTLVTQYDVELVQRIEKLIGQKMVLYPTERDEVLLLLERVQEAERVAAMELREADEGRRKKRKGKGGKGGGKW